VTTDRKDDQPKKQGEDRRGALKKLLAGGGVIVGGSALPSEWTKPVIESVITPAHAGMSSVTTVAPTTPAATSTSS
jgi:hypothetical protein